jgi:dCMP deaminase
MMDKRPSWDEYFMSIARLVAGRSTCLRRHVGALLVRDRHILATGYNGPPRGLPHCDVTGCVREKLGVPTGERHELCRGIHAEQNAIIQSANYGTGIRGATVYTTLHPCSVCAKMIINAGLTRVVTDDSYPDDLASEMLRDAGVVVDQLPDLVSAAARSEADPAAGADSRRTDEVASTVSADDRPDPETRSG